MNNLIIMKEDGNSTMNKDGFRTTNESKKLGVIRMRQMLIDRRVKFYAALKRAAGKHAENDAKELRKHLIDQLFSFQVISKPAKDIWAENKQFFSGKLSGSFPVVRFR